ncbi:DUF5615 family PIN-like protein [Picosynechococcus sp. PCC 8807]|uniref:DUF5615 family PIN-like protein n=1 Tax=Picosynechococcus sp. PCC 8807 TaxID=195248 RepID=UPI0008105FDA|nr:DUF5615 family PIN-like protein [Picosynechococcus sp. PCC 8807]ANV90212.1 hypothetical protein AWQ24_06010 [Picosynechococcus sp. PCC 8807]
MKFLVDAQLPKRLANFLNQAGYDAKHTSDLPAQNATPDSFINDLSLQEERIVITKDADFVESFFLQNKPYKLLLISTGNIKNKDLEDIISQNIQQISQLFVQHRYIELNRTQIIVHQ